MRVSTDSLTHCLKVSSLFFFPADANILSGLYACKSTDADQIWCHESDDDVRSVVAPAAVITARTAGTHVNTNRMHWFVKLINTYFSYNITTLNVSSTVHNVIKWKWMFAIFSWIKNMILCTRSETLPEISVSARRPHVQVKAPSCKRRRIRLWTWTRPSSLTLHQTQPVFLHCSEVREARGGSRRVSGRWNSILKYLDLKYIYRRSLLWWWMCLLSFVSSKSSSWSARWSHCCRTILF